MQKVTVGDYTIDIFVDRAFSPNDSVHKYDYTYFDQTDSYCSTIIGIELYEEENLQKAGVIGAGGGATGIYNTSFVFDNNRIVICCSDSVFCLSIPDLSLLWKTKADMATCFEIYKYKSDYIIHGELEITRLGHDGEIIWQQSGADIFTGPFVIADDYILATDWDNKEYKFDFDGDSVS